MKQILIVEDDSLLNKTLAYNLASDGYEVMAALNAKNAEAKLTTNEYDMVLLDINLPDGNGFELCKLIKPEHPDTVVLFLTANDQGVGFFFYQAVSVASVYFITAVNVDA